MSKFFEFLQFYQNNGYNLVSPCAKPSPIKLDKRINEKLKPGRAKSYLKASTLKTQNS